MAIQVQGFGGTVAEVDAGNRALRVTIRALDYGSLGSYSISHLSGTMAAGLAANAEIFHCRWSDATRLAIIQNIFLDGLAGSATAFTAGFAKVDCLFARGWSADGSGGTTLTITGNNAKMRTTMGTTLFGAIRGSATAALTAGTKTLDTQAIGQYGFSIGVAVSAVYVPMRLPLIQLEASASVPPVVLAQNEGLVVRATVPATGTWQFGATMQWTEVTAY